MSHYYLIVVGPAKPRQPRKKAEQIKTIENAEEIVSTGTPKLSTKRVLNYANNSEKVAVPESIYHTTLGYCLRYPLLV